MSSYTYKTIQTATEGVFTDKGSKFIGYVFPVESEEDFKQQLKKLKSEHPGARHFCYAYRLGESTITERSNDDGEPSGTAGKPILNQLISAEITQSAIVVVRYFGGTLLGTSGLINAYKSAAKAAIENGKIVEKEMVATEITEVNYAVYNDFMMIIKRNNIIYETIESNDHSTIFKLQIPMRIHKNVLKEINHLIQ